MARRRDHLVGGPGTAAASARDDQARVSRTGGQAAAGRGLGAHVGRPAAASPTRVIAAGDSAGATTVDAGAPGRAVRAVGPVAAGASDLHVQRAVASGRDRGRGHERPGAAGPPGAPMAITLTLLTSGGTVKVSSPAAV